MKHLNRFLLICLWSSGLVWAQENTTEIATGPENANSDRAIKAKALMQSRNGSQAKGTVEFIQGRDTVHVQYNIEGLGKKKIYGFHIHEKGDCSAPDAKSAGGHYLPTGKGGGTSLDSPQKYAGDMPQLKSDSSGRAEGFFSIGNLSVNEKNGIMGRAVVIHGGPDNPNEPSAPRIACGVIR